MLHSIFVIPKLIHQLEIDDNPWGLRRQQRQTGTLPAIDWPDVGWPRVGSEQGLTGQIADH